jgi:hypothetical protein
MDIADFLTEFDVILTSKHQNDSLSALSVSPVAEPVNAEAFVIPAILRGSFYDYARLFRMSRMDDKFCARAANYACGITGIRVARTGWDFHVWHCEQQKRVYFFALPVDTGIDYKRSVRLGAYVTSFIWWYCDDAFYSEVRSSRHRLGDRIVIIRTSDSYVIDINRLSFPCDRHSYDWGIMVTGDSSFVYKGIRVDYINGRGYYLADEPTLVDPFHQ